MELREAIEKRRSTRSFLKKEVRESEIIEILKYANLAPSAGNLQARDFIVVDDEEIKRELSRAALNQTFIEEAPIDIVVCANLERISPYGRRGIELYCLQDAAASIEHILLMALEYNLSACWVGAFEEKRVSEILRLPSYIRPVAIVPIGYSKRIPGPTSRIDIGELVHFNGW
jgi:nitroreductase